MLKEVLERELDDFVQKLSLRNLYKGNRIPPSIMDMIEVEIRDDGGGVLAPFWLSVLQKGRGPRKNTKDHRLVLKIYRWMEKRNMFTSTTQAGRMNEARRLTWYINKYGNEQFRNKVFVDVYKTLREETIVRLEKHIFDQVEKITSQIL